MDKKDLKQIEGLLDRKLRIQSKDLKGHMDFKEETLARMIKKGFDGVDEKLNQVIEELDVRKELGQLKTDFQIMKDKLEEALHVQF